MSIPLDPKVKDLTQVPHTISFVIRKMQQIDNLNELPKEKRPPDDILWDGSPEDLDDWLERVMNTKKGKDEVQFIINDVEG